MKTINIGKTIGALTFLAVSPFMIRSCSIQTSNFPYKQANYKGTHYSFSVNGISGETYKITLKDGTKLRCDNFRGPLFGDRYIDSVIVYDVHGDINKTYKNSIMCNDKNDNFLGDLSNQVAEAERFIRNETKKSNLLQMQAYDEQLAQEQQKFQKEQSGLLSKIKGEN